MPEEIKKEWIVLINRAPKGPLIQLEIQALIEEGILRRNDLACEVRKDKTEKTDWKFLWQYPEFDRRIDPVALKTPSTNDALPSESVIKERRESVEDEDLKYKAKSLLPEDIASIRTEDLLLHSTSVTSKAEPDLSEDDVKLNLPSGERSRPEIVFAGIGLVVVMLFFFVRALKSDRDKTTAEKNPKSMKLPLEQSVAEARSPANTQPKRPGSAIVPTNPSSILPPKAPEQRDQGDIAYEEYRRKRDAEIERERQREEEEKNNEAKADEENDENAGKKKKGRDKADDEEVRSNDAESENPVSEEPAAEDPHPED